MTIKQGKKLCVSIAAFFGVVVITMALLKIPEVARLFSVANVKSRDGIWLWVLVWIFIMLECAIIPGPYLPFVVFFSQTSMAENKLLFLIYCTSAVFVGRIGAYFVGYKFGGKLLKWTAEEDFDKWCNKLSGPAGKWTYAITVAAPGFPDFVLAIVAGAIRINFWFYIIVNVLCKGIENALIIYFSYLMGGNFSWLWIFVGMISIAIITFIILSIVEMKKNKTPQE